MLTHEAFDISHLEGNSVHTVTYDFSQYTTGPQFTTVNTGSGAAPIVGFNDVDGPALKMQLVADPGTVSLTGPVISPSKVKAAIVDVEGLTYTGSGAPLWGVGFYDAPVTSYAEMFRDNTGLAVTAQINSSGTREIQKTGQGTALVVKDARAGLFLDFTTGKVTGHIGYSMVQTSTYMPTADLNFRVRALTTGTQNNFNVLMRKVTLTIIR